MNIYTQRIPRTTVTKPLSPTPPPSINHQSSQTTLSCSPFKAVSLQRRSQLKATSSQTEAVNPIPKTDSSTQTSNHGNQATIATATTPSLDIPVSSVRGVREPEPTDEKEINSTSLQSNGIEEAERSKQTLLQKLRELDVQTSAPSSKPLTSSPSIGPTRQSHVTVSPPPTVATNLLTNKPSMTQHDVAGEEHERKKLLLAKLMAIDEGSDPNQLKTVTPQQTSSQKPLPHQVEPRIQQVVSTNRISANKSSTSSTSSWSEVIDNMHHGRPAHASDEDPFGSRSRLNSLKKTKTKQGDGVSVREKIFITESSIDTRQGLPIQQAELEEEDRDGDGDGDGDGGDYKPSFGRRAQRQSVDQSIIRPTNTQPHPPWLQQPPADNKTTNTHPRLISSSSQLLPRRPKADTTAMRSNDVMPGAIISDPDDLEELVL